MDMRQTILARAEVLRGFPGQEIPEATPWLIGRAEKIAGGIVFFYGDTEVRVGRRDIDWTGSHIKHQEWPAQLNRFFHLAPLAAAYRASHDERFARAARSYIEDWIDSHAGYDSAQRYMPGDSGLNMSIRLGSSHASGWGGCLPAFLGSSAFDDVFLQKLMDSIAVQVAFLSGHLTPWGNWRISELDAVVFTALRFPFLSGSDALLERGIRGMGNALATQFLPDGVHIERSPGYHEWMAGVLASYYDLARRLPEVDARVDGQMVVRAFDYAAHDELFGVNDSRAPFRDPEALRNLRQRKEVLGRLFPDKGMPADPPLRHVFASAGHVFARSSWDPGADYLAFDAGTWGGGHGHLSRLSLVFRSGGRTLVADPGILNYEMSDPFGPYGKSTRAHSTLSLNGRNQSEADAQLLRAEFTETGLLLHARYGGGYWEGDYAWSFDEGRGSGLFGIHDRIVFWVNGEYLLVLDSMVADAGATVHNCWQMGPTEAWASDTGALNWWSRNPDVNLLARCIPFAGAVEMECFDGSREPIRGWVGAHGHDAVPAPLLEFRYPSGTGGDSSTAVILAPFRGENPPSYLPRQAARAGWGPLRHLELGLPSGGADLFSWSRDLSAPADQVGPVSSDARFVWLRLDASGRPARCFLLDGSYLEHEGRLLLETPRRGSFSKLLG
ncbi:MAG: heparinase II/III family protein [Armatimonadota bacterium]